jgi:hypothetical protein
VRAPPPGVRSGGARRPGLIDRGLAPRSEVILDRVTTTPESLLAEAPLQAAVSALADRNQHHFAQMSEDERREAVATWRDLAVTVLTAAGAAVDQPEPLELAAPGSVPGRAVLVFEDSGQDEIAVHATLYPQPETRGEDMIVTPAQAAALELLQGMAEEGPQG